MIPQIKKILYTTDLSDNSIEVLKYAMHSARKYEAGIIILYVLESLSVTGNADHRFLSYRGAEKEDLAKKNSHTSTIGYKSS